MMNKKHGMKKASGYKASGAMKGSKGVKYNGAMKKGKKSK